MSININKISGQDKAVLDTVLAPSQYIDAIILNVIIRDLDYIIQYIGQRYIYIIYTQSIPINHA